MLYKVYLPCDITPSSNSACHIPVACALVCIVGDRFNNQSTNSVPGAQRRINLPDTFLSFKHVFLAEMKEK